MIIYEKIACILFKAYGEKAAQGETEAQRGSIYLKDHGT